MGTGRKSENTLGGPRLSSGEEKPLESFKHKDLAERVFRNPEQTVH